MNYKFFEYIRNIGTIAIYGYGFLGQLLVKDFTMNGIKILYIIDRRKISDGDLKILRPGKKYDDVDVMIVSTLFYTDNIVHELKKLGYMNAVALADFLLKIEQYGDTQNEMEKSFT